MADQTRNMQVKLTGDTSDFKRAMNDVVSSNEKVESSIKKTAAGVALGMGGYQLFTNALRKVGGFFADSTKAADQQELAVSRLAAGINNVKSATDKHIGSLIAQATALQQTTRFSDEQVISGQGILATFQLNQRAIEMLTPRLLDMSEGLAHVTGQMPDLESNAILVAKAIGGEDTAGLTGALRKAGVVMTDQQKQVLQYGNMQQRLGVITQVLDGNFKGLAVAAGNTAAGGMAKLHNQVNEVQEVIGLTARAVTGGLVGALTKLVGNNTSVVASLAIAGGAMLLFGAAVFAVTRLVEAFGIESMIAMLTNPLTAALLAVGVLLGGFVFAMLQKVQNKMKDFTANSGQLAKTMTDDVPAGIGASSKAMADLQKQLQKIDDQIMKANRDFQEQLAEMVQSHEAKVKDLKDQLDQENSDFADQQKGQTESFKDAQTQMSDEHSKKVDTITRQINQLLSKGKDADQQELADLRSQLDQENQQYAADAIKKQQKYDEDVAKQQAAHDKKTADLQKQLDDENALLTKHAADVASIRNVTLLDEIDKLKRSHDEQNIAFAQQKADAIENAKQTSGGVSDVWNTANGQLNDQFKGMGDQMGAAMGDAFMKALKDSFKEVGSSIANWLRKINDPLKTAGDKISNAIKALDKATGGGDNNDWMTLDQVRAAQAGGRASGGAVTAGNAYRIMESGGRETFVPDINGQMLSPGQTKRLTEASNDSPQQVTQHISQFSINLELGMYVGMPSEKREIAAELWREITRLARAQGVQLPQIGVQVQ